jgi:hypothetical protein
MRFISYRKPAKPLWVKYIFVKGAIGSQSFNPKPFRYTLQFFTPCKALPGFFLCIFSFLTCPKKPVFSKRDLLWWKVPAGWTRIFWPADSTSQPVTISKKWKNPSSTLLRKRTCVQALRWFLTCSLSLLASGTDLKSRKVLRPFSYTSFINLRFISHLRFQFSQNLKITELFDFLKKIVFGIKGSIFLKTFRIEEPLVPRML